MASYRYVATARLSSFYNHLTNVLWISGPNGSTGVIHVQPCMIASYIATFIQLKCSLAITICMHAIKITPYY